MNRVCLSGTIAQYGVKLDWTEAGEPQTHVTLDCEQPSKGGASNKTFI
jgi:hypothetical protein